MYILFVSTVHIYTMFITLVILYFPRQHNMNVLLPLINTVIVLDVLS